MTINELKNLKLSCLLGPKKVKMKKTLVLGLDETLIYW